MLGRLTRLNMQKWAAAWKRWKKLLMWINNAQLRCGDAGFLYRGTLMLTQGKRVHSTQDNKWEWLFVQTLIVAVHASSAAGTESCRTHLGRLQTQTFIHAVTVTEQLRPLTRKSNGHQEGATHSIIFFMLVFAWLVLCALLIRTSAWFSKNRQHRWAINDQV